MPHFSLYAIYGVTHRSWHGRPFDVTRLPFQIVDGVHIEDVTACFRQDEFKYVEKRLGTDAVEDLRGIHYALVHRFDGQETYEDSGPIPEDRHIAKSEEMLRNIAALFPITEAANLTVFQRVCRFYRR